VLKLAEALLGEGPASLLCAQTGLRPRSLRRERVENPVFLLVECAGCAVVVVGELRDAALTNGEVHQRVESLLCEVDSGRDRARSSHQASAATPAGKL